MRKQNFILKKDNPLEIDDEITHTSSISFPKPKFFTQYQKKKISNNVFQTEIKLNCIYNDLEQTVDITHKCKIEFTDTDFDSFKLLIFAYEQLICKLKELEGKKFSWVSIHLPKKISEADLQRLVNTGF